MLTGIKDLDHAILNKLEDKDLVNMCSVNKNADEVCKDQTFWFNRILTKFPEIPSEIFVKNKGDRSWSDYYITELIKIAQDPNKFLLEGSEKGREDLVIVSLNKGADVNTKKYSLPYEKSPIMLASKNGHSNIVKILLEAGANSQENIDMALKMASNYGYPEVVKMLLGAGADVKTGDFMGSGTPLRNASRGGHVEVVKILLANGANASYPGDETLPIASREGHSEVVKILLANGADVHTSTGLLGSDAALTEAVYYNHIDTVKILLDAGADVHSPRYGVPDFPLVMAKGNRNRKMIDLLKQYE